MSELQLDLCWTGPALHALPQPLIEAPPAHRGVATSQDASQAVAPRASSMRRAVYDCLARHGACTREEIADLTGIRLQTVCGRVSELRALALVRKSGERRAGRSGVPAECVEVCK